MEPVEIFDDRYPYWSKQGVCESDGVRESEIDENNMLTLTL